MPDIYLCEIVEKQELADQTFSITVSCGKLASAARAGQFLHIRCGAERLLRRPISICRADGETLRFVFEIKGEGTRWLSMRESGQSLDILGPLGNGFQMPDGNALIIGGGLGAPPMLFAAESAKGAVTTVLGFRNSSRIIMKNEFEAISETLYITTDDGSFGIHGTVTVPLGELLEKGGYEAVLACGQRAMLSGVAELCRQYDVPCQVSMEERMGCGIGACLVCACKTVTSGAARMSRVCKDGPVFDAREIVW